MNHSDPDFRERLRSARIHRITGPVRRFLAIQTASGLVLFACAVVAMILANSPLAAVVEHFWETTIHLGFGSATFDQPLHFWINDGLMAVFFFVVGLEIKRELIGGELRTFQKALLPAIAALGGMIAPALVYASYGFDGTASRGWGVPMATDIAFVVGVMALFGSRVPFGLKIFLLSLAIVDDLGAVIVIAVFYTEQINQLMLGLAVGGFILIATLNWLGVRPVAIYLVVGLATWLAVYKSGIHPTIAGVVLGFLTPYRPWLARGTLRLVFDDLGGKIAETPEEEELGPADVAILRYAAREVVSPLARLEDRLHPWVGYAVMPVFALANAGVPLKPESLGDAVGLMIALALVVGKTVGILGFSYIAVKCKLARLPDGVTWPMMLAAAMLGGIGFTMALFIAGLAFARQAGHLEAAKTGILLGSLAAGIGGAVLLRWAVKRNESGGTVSPRS
jgi:NhaA family Na+:H+ antiporter